MRGWRLISALWLILAATCSCQIDPPLHFRKAVDAEIVLSTKVQVDFMWQVNWEAIWDFAWVEEALGPLSYKDPKSMRLHVYTQGPDGEPISHQTHNFMGQEGSVRVFVGTHNFLFHNNDSHVILFESEDDLAPVQATTRIISPGLRESAIIQTIAQKSKAESDDDIYTGEEHVAYAPDELFSLFDWGHVITDDLSTYEYIDGRYVLRIKGELLPSTFIYLIQVRLHNNKGRVVGCGGGAAITGVAAGVDLVTRQTWDQTVSIPFDMYINKEEDPDLLGGRVMSFGLKGCRNPYGTNGDEKEADDARHYLVLSLTYDNGGYKNVRIDITDQFQDLPTGGVITVDLDVNDFPPDDVPPNSGGGGGFQALIGEWGEQTGSTTIIN